MIILNIFLVALLVLIILDISLGIFFFEVVLRIQFSSFAQSCLTLCSPRDCSTPGFPAHHQLPELAQTQSANHNQIPTTVQACDLGDGLS